MKKSGFVQFLLKGNVVELATAVVIGGAITLLVTAIVNGFINPILATFLGTDALSSALIVTLPSGAELQFGAILQALINFIAIAAVVYFVLVKPIAAIRQRFLSDEEEAASAEVSLLEEIRDLLKK